MALASQLILWDFFYLCLAVKNQLWQCSWCGFGILAMGVQSKLCKICWHVLHYFRKTCFRVITFECKDDKITSRRFLQKLSSMHTRSRSRSYKIRVIGYLIHHRLPFFLTSQNKHTHCQHCHTYCRWIMNYAVCLSGLVMEVQNWVFIITKNDRT